jgi:phosphopantothenoylcysteine decarboxylase/phosphopantothenate--cysteine ligase
MTVVCSRPAETPLFVFPAMDSDMWLQPATQRNVELLRSDGITVVDPESGELASGLVGHGRLPEIETIVKAITEVRNDGSTSVIPSFSNSVLPLSRHLLITAGPTHERIDAVRSIVNHSTGTMGFALAAAAQRRGYLVTLVTGPVSLPTPFGVERVDVTSAAEMYEAVMRHREEADIFIMSAAVADYTPAAPLDVKLKKDVVGEHASIELVRTKDILAEIGAGKNDSQKVVGFALETGDVVGYAKEKLERKNADMIVANAANAPDSGFGSGRNTITIITNDGPTSPFPPMSKTACAEVILDAIERL